MKFNSGDARSYKEVHEAFVSNLKGTSAGDVFIILVHLPLAILLLKLVQGSSRPLYLRDLMYLALPLLLSLTVLADFSYLSGVLLLIGELFVLQMRHVKSIRVTDTDNSVDTSLNPPQSNQLTFISLFKGVL